MRNSVLNVMIRRNIMNILNLMVGAGLSAAFALGGTGSTLAQDYPTKTVRFVAGAPVGSAVDVVVRALADEMARRTGQSFVQENIPGGRQVPTVLEVKNANPDGYTLLVATQNAITINPLTIEDLPYDPLKDLVPITRVVNQQHVVTFRGPEGTDWENWTYDDLVEYSIENPDKIFFGSNGNGSSAHLSFVWQMNESGATFTHVPYRDGLTQPFLSGQINLIQGSVSQEVEEWYNSGFAKPLAAPSHLTGLPDVPSFDEVFGEEYAFAPWTGLFAPADTPEPVIERLRDLVEEIMGDEAFVERYVIPAGLHPAPTDSGDEFRTYLEAQIPAYRDLLVQAGVEVVEETSR